MPKFRLHWTDGKTQDLEGHDIIHAFNKMGYGRDVLRALSYWEELKQYEQNQHEKYNRESCQDSQCATTANTYLCQTKIKPYV